MITRRSKYAIRAILVLARHRHEGALSVDAIAREDDLPRKFLEAIMLDLKVAGIVQATRGKHGGYSLLRSPSRITVGQVIRAAQGPIAPAPCVSATAYGVCEDCRSEAACSVRPVLMAVREAISRVIDLKSVEALARETEALGREAVADFHI
ncbi:MAG: Rrf2 family transcriptional regulator [Opitutaceae bacterium]|nr:Rrf2 family transcriptional regulator [Opitutaceae bacterium]